MTVLILNGEELKSCLLTFFHTFCNISLSVASSIFQSSTFGFAGVFPFKYTSVVLSGQVMACFVLSHNVYLMPLDTIIEGSICLTEREREREKERMGVGHNIIHRWLEVCVHTSAVSHSSKLQSCLSLFLHYLFLSSSSLSPAPNLIRLLLEYLLLLLVSFL